MLRTSNGEQESLWTRDRWTGNYICAVCGALREGRATCCPVAPYLSFEDFVEQYWGKEDVPTGIAKEFYEDYQLSDCAGLEEYIKDTRSSADEM
jgi:hypothetical protein